MRELPCAQSTAVPGRPCGLRPRIAPFVRLWRSTAGARTSRPSSLSSGEVASFLPDSTIPDVRQEQHSNRASWRETNLGSRAAGPFTSCRSCVPPFGPPRVPPAGVATIVVSAANTTQASRPLCRQSRTNITGRTPVSLALSTIGSSLAKTDRF